MADNPRIEELRRRVLADPASIAFAALAEEYRRIGRYQDAIDTCRTGLLRHPAYLSARVTLGRALIEIGDHAAARDELETVLKSAPENLAAIRGLAQIHERMGHSAEMDPQLAEMMANVEPLPPAPAAPLTPVPPPAAVQAATTPPSPPAAAPPEPPPAPPAQAASPVVVPPPVQAVPAPLPHVEPEPEPVLEAVPPAAFAIEPEPERSPATTVDPFAPFAFVPEPTHEVAPDFTFEFDTSGPPLIHEERHDAELEPAAFDILDEISAPPLGVSSEAFTIGTFEIETPRTREPLTSATREPANLGTLKRLEQFLSAIHQARSELSAHQ